MPFIGRSPTIGAIDDNIVTTAKLADDAVTSAKIGVDVIVAEDLAANSITVSEITDGVITEAKLNIDNTPTNDYVLTAKSSAAGGLTWAAAAAIAGITSNADATAMTIDSSERIVMPSQPMFYATSISAVSGGSLVNVGQSPGYIYDTAGNTTYDAQAMSFNKIWLNVGSHWNNTTGQFNVPVAGRYLAYFNNNYHNATNWPNGFIIHSVDGGSHYRVAQSWMQHTITGADPYYPLISFAIINAGVDDKIWPAYSSGYNAPLTSTNFGYHQLAIMLLG